MKLNKIKALCLEKYKCFLTEREGCQLIGTGAAFYSTDSVEIAENEITGLFDLNEKQENKMLTDWVLDADFGEEMGELKPSMMTVTGVDEFIPLTDESGIVYFVRAREVEAARGKAEYRRYYLNIRKDGLPIIAIRDGISAPCAYIAPITEAAARVLMREMEAIGTGTPGGIRRTEREDGKIDGQTSMLEVDS